MTVNGEPVFDKYPPKIWVSQLVQRSSPSMLATIPEAVDPSVSAEPATQTSSKMATDVKPAPAETTATQAVQAPEASASQTAPSPPAIDVPARKQAATLLEPPAALGQAAIKSPIAETTAEHQQEAPEPAIRLQQQVVAVPLPEAPVQPVAAPAPPQVVPDTSARPREAPLRTPAGAAEAAGVSTPPPSWTEPRSSHLNPEAPMEITCHAQS
ncbi:predicted GPI-anchored protein 58 [Bufo bufo]|uniref:predicted GPI-anchored protein 58 n=1 Tax=Bufo bufo TaxID=8384 RepID=UPI001ABDEF56|nr:predicted GPI-anchored protein 58 [Bufo bufo]